MRNLRKTRKYGGLSVTTVMDCVSPHTTSDKCINAFLERDGFIRIKTPPDGNCFYHTLTKFLQLTQRPPPPNNIHLELREKVVSKMEENIDDIIPYLVINNSNINNSNNNANVRRFSKYLEELDSLRGDGEWNSDSADLVSQYAAKALNMRIKIYDIKSPEKSRKILSKRLNNGTKIYEDIPAQPRKIVCYTFEPEVDLGITVQMLRIGDSHYELLYPQTAPVVPPLRRRVTIKKSLNKKESNVKKYGTNKSRMDKSRHTNKPFTRLKPNNQAELESNLMKIAIQESKASQNRLSNDFFNALSSVDFNNI